MPKTLKTPYRDSDGKLISLLGVSRDINDPKHTEVSLKESAVRNRAILIAVPSILFIYSRKGYYLDYHTSDQSLLAVVPEHFIGKSFKKELPQKVTEMFLQGFERVYAANQLQIINLPFNSRAID